MNALRVFILTVALLAPGLIPALCGESCGGPACPKTVGPAVCFTDEPASCCSESAPAAPARSPLAPRSPASCCCVQGPMETPRTPPAPQQQVPDDEPVAELPRAWTHLAAFDGADVRGRFRSPSPAWRPGGGNPMQSVLCIWRN